jgi:putative two-component system response regulator
VRRCLSGAAGVRRFTEYCSAISDFDTAPATSLLIDDDSSIVVLLERLLQQWGYGSVVGTTDSAGAVDLVELMRPDLVLLDLTMPPPGGLEILESLRWLTCEPDGLPVLVLTGDGRPEIKEAALDAGARDFVEKPFEPADIRLRIEKLLRARRHAAGLVKQRDSLQRELGARTRDLEQTQMEMLERLALAAEFRDDDSREHPQRVGRTAGLLAVQLGLDADEAELVRRAAPLHDVGKLGVPDGILLLPGPLSDVQYKRMQRHTAIGHEILSGSRAPVLQMAAEIALRHHERWDGTGYPSGLAGTNIPLSGRLTAVADVFDALTHPRPYRQAGSVEATLTEMRRAAGSQFDPAVVSALEALDHDALLAPVAPKHGTPAVAGLSRLAL